MILFGITPFNVHQLGLASPILFPFKWNDAKRYTFCNTAYAKGKKSFVSEEKFYLTLLG